ncbi:conjugal transfer protein TrbL family protein [Mangrovihabitans endophyticus]|uniref:TrbL/VirB6 plasmid conjugal transfer protein n=1 Tax=Mangrovihabitans endophyticus TaxID=1751298 RepID=A0A8J3C5J5_9ACTN|nr:conjugal transfer protein TrbL family protein [Mangrovihabitans endophyticus]GGL12578.1 hypothetical protein GCM10012284_54040 [Mangrovihabitans endophyticus]
MTDWLISGLIDAIVTWLAAVIIAGLNILWDLLSATAFTSPDVTLLPQVQSVSRTSLAIVNTCYVLALLWMAILVLGRDTLQSRYGPGELIPRLVIGLIGANLAMPLCSQLIGLANAVTTALTSQAITAPGSLRQMRQIVTGSLAGPPGTDPGGFLLILIGLVIAVMVAMLLVQWIVRVGVLIVAVGIAPIALALHGTPQTEPAAKLWWRTMLGVLGIVVVQAVALHTTMTVFLGPQADLPALGLPGKTGTVMTLLIVLCLLWAILKIPSMMRRYVTRSSPSPVATMVRVLLVQQLTRGVRRGIGRAGAARTAAGRGPGRQDLPWPIGPSGRGGNRPVPPPAASARPATVRTLSPLTERPASPSPRRASRPDRVPSRPPAGAGPGVVGTAYPTGRPVRPYTPDEIAGGVDVYTRSLRRRAATAPSRGTAAPSGRNRS